jgi:hypothetical protein
LIGICQRLVAKNGSQKDTYYDEVGLCAQIHSPILLGASVNTIKSTSKFVKVIEGKRGKGGGNLLQFLHLNFQFKTQNENLRDF